MSDVILKYENFNLKYLMKTSYNFQYKEYILYSKIMNSKYFFLGFKIF